MSDNPVDNVVEETPDPVDPDTVPVVEEPTEPETVPVEDRPPYVDELLDKMDSLVTAITGSNGGGDQSGDGAGLPGDGEPVPDESPVKKPWTHRGLFGNG